MQHGMWIYYVGGCDYRKDVCYKDTYLLDTEKLTWASTEDFKNQREDMSMNAIGGLFYMFGGC